MTSPVPPDDGRRPYRPSRWIMLVLVLLGGIALILLNRPTGPKNGPDEEDPNGKAEENTNAKAEEGPHPLVGKRRIYLADGSLFRFKELTFTRNFSKQHDFPGAVLREGDPCLWLFEGVENRPHVYRILCADPNFPQFDRANLTYTRLVNRKGHRDDVSPYVTLRDDDPCEWKILAKPYRDQYEIFCDLGHKPWKGKSLGWMTDQKDLKREMVSATLGQNGNPSWFILPERVSPKRPSLVTHLVIMPRKETDLVKRSRESFKKKGHSIFRVVIETMHEEITREAKDLSYVALVKAIRSDPVVNHKDFPPMVSFDTNTLVDQAINRSDNLFPLIIPLNLGIRTYTIKSLTLENTDFWHNRWDTLENFQERLDKSDESDGRVYGSPHFVYLFVTWEP